VVGRHGELDESAVFVTVALVVVAAIQVAVMLMGKG
jgi:hypothetical protein